MSSPPDRALDTVRGILAAQEEVELPDGMVPPPPDDASPGAQDPGWDGVDPGGPPPPAADGAADPPEKRCAGLPLNDLGNGLRLIAHFGEDLLHVPRVGWFVWTGQRWRLDPDQIEVRRMAHRLTDLIAREIWHIRLPDADAAAIAGAGEGRAVIDEIGAIPPRDRSEEQVRRLAEAQRSVAAAEDAGSRRDKAVARRLTHARNAGNSNAIKNLMAEAAAVIARGVDDLDAAPLQVNTESGVLCFEVRPGEDDGGQNPPRPVASVTLVPHRRDQLLSKMMPVVHDPRARCPQFDAFLERVQPSAEMRRFIQRWSGLSMTGLTGEQKFAFYHGGGRNGKSVMNDLLARMLGDYAASAKIESITGKNRRGGGDATPDLMPLIGARMVRASEPEQGVQLQEGLVKEMTGGEPILVRALNQDFILIYPRFKLTISGNHKPEIYGGDDGIWRRVLLVPWDVQIPPDEVDPDLKDKLWEERSGILNWLIGGLLDYLEGGLQVPEAVSAATREYREDSDPVGTFLTLCCTVTGDAADTIPAKDLSRAVNYWLEDSGRGSWTPGTVFKRLKAKAERWKSPETGHGFRARKSSTSYYDGLRFKADFNDRFRAASTAGAGRAAPAERSDADDM